MIQKKFFNYLTEVVLLHRVIFKTKGFSPSCKVPDDDDRNRGDGPSPTLAPPPIRPLIFFSSSRRLASNPPHTQDRLQSVVVVVFELCVNYDISVVVPTSTYL